MHNYRYLDYEHELCMKMCYKYEHYKNKRRTSFVCCVWLKKRENQKKKMAYEIA